VIPLGLTSAELQAFHRALAASHTVKVSVAVLDMNGDAITSITPQVIDGQVNVDADAEITRSATVTFLDPHHALHFDSNAPSDGAIYADRMIRIFYSVLVDELGKRVSVPVFTGPLVKFDRSGDTVTIEAQGKELFGMSEMYRPLTLKKGMNTVEAIRTVLRTRMGEQRLALPAGTRAKLPKTVSYDRLAFAWQKAKSLAASIDRHLYYDGAGTCRLRRPSGTPVFTFLADAEHANITSDVQVSNSMDSVKNLIWVKGGKPKGAKKAVGAVAAAPASHPLSPQRIGQNGVPRYLVEVIQNDNIRSTAAARALAKRTLNSRLSTVSGVTFNSVPIPHLDPLDLVRVQTGDFSANVRIRSWSLPLSTSGDMSVGYLRRVAKPNRNRIR